jgi:hypothetical protein
VDRTGLVSSTTNTHASTKEMRAQGKVSGGATSYFPLPQKDKHSQPTTNARATHQPETRKNVYRTFEYATHEQTISREDSPKLSFRLPFDISACDSLPRYFR